MARYVAPTDICRICGGPIYDRGLFAYQNHWLHRDKEDWQDNPHNAEPVGSYADY